MRADPAELRRRLAQVARSQGGYFSTAQALEAGYSYQAQKYHTDRGNWRRVDRGLYRLPEWPLPNHGDLIRWTIWSRGRGVVSHDSALAVHELGDVNPSRVHLTVPQDFRAQAPGVALHRGVVPEEDVVPREGFTVTAPERTLLDLAGGDLERAHFEAAVREALERGLVSRRDLLARSEEFGPRAALRLERALGAAA